MEEEFTNLHLALRQDDSKQAEKCIQRLENLFTEELDSETLDEYLLITFDETTGLLVFIKEALVKNYGPCLVSAMNLIYILVNNLREKLEPHLPSVIERCVEICSRNSMSLAQKKTFSVLQLLIDLNLNISQAMLADIYKLVLKKLQIEQTSAGVLSNLLVLLGKLSRKKVSIITTDTQVLSNLLMSGILPGIQDKTTELEGFFTCITDYLYNFELVNLNPLYEILEINCNFIKKSSGKDIKIAKRAALKLFSVHTSLFSDRIRQRYEWWDVHLRMWINEENSRDDYKAGIIALDAFNKEMADVLNNRKDLEYFLNAFNSDIKNKMRISIRALGYFAAAFKLHLNDRFYNLFMSLMEDVEHTYVLGTVYDVDNLPDYIRTLSKFVKHLNDSSHINSIQKLEVLMIKLFPKFSVVDHKLVVDSLTEIIVDIKIDKLDEFLNCVIHQGILWSCSHPLPTDESTVPSYKSYLPLWTSLIKKPEPKIRALIIDVLVKRLLILINKLNLSTEGLIIENQNDMTIFVNVIDLYVNILEQIEPTQFQTWIPRFTTFIIRKSINHPLISGFYKILAVNLKICNVLNYFAKERLQKQHVHETFEILHNFIQSLLQRIRQYSDISCTQVILAAPIEIIESIETDYMFIFVNIFLIGRNDFPLIITAVECLERWYKFLPQTKIRPILKKVFPHLDSFLRTNVVTDYGNFNTEQFKKKYNKRRLLIETQPELLTLQKKILALLGKMDDEICLEFVRASGQIEHTGVSKDIYLKVIIPFPKSNCNIDLYLDKFIPRLLELVRYNGDFKTRCTAMELLHSAVMVLLGKCDSMGIKAVKLDPLIKNVTETLLHLAVDVDGQWLFYEFILQLMRWYSHPKQPLSTQMIILDVVLDGICHPNNSAIRSISGICLKEYVTWIKKQTSEEQMQTNPNMEIIIQKLKYYAAHPDPSKQIGAALIFNNIYTQLREEKIWLNKYTVDLINTFVSNLSIMESHDSETKTALKHISRILKERAFVFKKTSVHRITPHSWHGNSLNDVADYLLKNATSLHANCRNICMDMYLNIASETEKQLLLQHTLINKHFLEHDFNINPIKWLESLIALLEMHSFILKVDAQLLNTAINFSDYLSEFLKQKMPSSDKFNILKVTLMKRIFEFVDLVLETDLQQKYLTKDLLSLLYNYVFEYSFLPFLSFDYNIWKEVKSLFIKLHEHNLLLEMHSYVYAKWKKLPNINVQAVQQSQRQLLKGVLLLDFINFDFDLNDGGVKRLLDDFVAVQKLPIPVRELCELKMKVLLRYEGQFHVLVSTICSSSLITNLENDLKLCLGVFLIDEFKDIITESICLRKSRLDIFFNAVNAMQKHSYEIITSFLRNLPVLKDPESIIDSVAQIWKSKKYNNNNIFEMVEILANIKKPIGNNIILDSVLTYMQQNVIQNLNSEEFYITLNQAIYALGLVCDEECKENFDNLNTILKNLKTVHGKTFNMPSKIKSTTLIIKTMFEAAQTSKSVDILTHAFDFHATLSHEFDTDLNDVAYIYMHNLPPEKQIKILFTIHISTNTLQKASYLSLLLRNADYMAFENFYVDSISSILKLPKNYEENAIDFVLIETLFAKLKIENILNKTCRISIAANCDLKKTCLIRAFNACKDARIDSEEYRLYQCMAYKAGVSIICNSNVREWKLYNKLLYRDGNDFWWKMIDDKVTYDFKITDVIKERKKLVSIRTKLNDSKNIGYIESQHLFNSTLSEDILRYDLAGMAIRSHESDEVHTLEVSITENDINQHECMSTFCGLVQHMEDEGIFDLDKNEPPIFITELRKLLLNAQTILNVKLFMARAIGNKQVVFKKYGKWLMGPILKIINDRTVGNSINCFVNDMIIMMVDTWSEVEIHEEDKHEIPNLLKFLMANVANVVADQKHNLELIKLIIENWKSVEVPYKLLLDQLDSTNDQEKLVGINLINILLSNNIAPWDGSIKGLAVRLIKLLQSDSKSIYHSSAETIGLALQFISQSETDRPKIENFLNLVTSCLKKIPITKLTNCIEALSKHYPLICKDFIKKILQVFHTEQHNIKLIYLKLFLKCAADVDFSKKVDFIPLVMDPNPEVVALSLELILKSIEKFSVPQLTEIVNKIKNFINNNNDIIRSIMYDIFMFCYRKFCDSDDDLCINIVNISKSVLLHGLSEGEAELEMKLLKFWNENEKMPTDMHEKLLFLLENMYKCSTEDFYLSYINYIILNCDENNPLFERGLGNCDFRRYDVQRNIRGQHSASVPLVASTLFSQNFEGNVLRATQSLLFEPTAPTESLAEKRQSFSQSGTSLMVKSDGVIKNPNQIKISTRYKHQHTYQGRNSFSNMAIKRNIKRETDRITRTKKLEKEYKVRRNYRIGELPDIEINLNDVLNPLKALAKLDAVTAKILFITIFDSLWTTCKHAERFKTTAMQAVNTIFSSSIYFTPTLMSTLLEIALKYTKSMQFHPKVISSVCRNSGLMSIGCLLLEEYLAYGIEVERPTKRGVAAEIDLETLHWIKLAELYKEIEEWDVVRSIFLDKMKSELALRAIEAESQGRFRDAQIEYQKVIQQDIDLDRKDFYYESYLKCYAELSEWKELSDCIEKTIAPWNCLWQQEFNKQKCMPFYISANTRIEPPIKTKLEEILGDLKDNQKSVHLKDNFSDELAFIGLLIGNTDFARHCIQTHISNFLTSWVHINPLFLSLRSRKIIDMRNSMEIYIFLNTFEDDRIGDHLAESWKNTSDKNVGTLIQAETRNLYRKQFARLIKDKHDLSANVVNMDMQLVEYALQRANFHVARKYIIKYREERHALRNKLLLSKLAMVKNIAEIKSLRQSFNIADEIIHNCDSETDFALQLKTALHLSEVSKRIEGLKLVGEDDKQEYAHGVLKQILEKCENDIKISNNVTKGYYKLAQFSLEQNNEEALIESTFKAMIYNCAEARMLFAYLLDLESLSDDRKKIFIEKSSNVPTWMFLRWIPQLLAHLDSNKAEAVAPVILRIAADYPNSLIYAYRISKKSYSNKNLQGNKVYRQLEILLTNTLVDKMLASLRSVAPPSAILKSVLINLKKKHSTSKGNFKEEFTSVFNDLYDKDYNYDDDESNRGQQFRDLDECKVDFEELLKEFDPTYRILSEKIKKMSDSTDLVNYSPWLKNFRGADYEEGIEIPGQYSGNTPPLMQYHIKIIRFLPKVTIFKSDKKPILLTILGSDGKEYKFLVKYGEDLRQDERIEQLFGLMNGILTKDIDCNKHKLSVVTYQVIPLMENLGIIEWVQDTKELREMVKDGLTKKTNIFEPIMESHHQWICAAKSQAPYYESYIAAMLKYEPKDTSECYQKLCDKFPTQDTLKKSFRNLCINAENYYAFRQEFIKSYAVMCICNWLIGIGDRHLSNILISTKTGQSVGIDFGHAFGTGTQEQKIPELVPIRLTPQIIFILQPHGINGILREIMIRTIETLRKNQYILLSTMKIFLQEPTLNWLAGVEDAEDVWRPEFKLDLAKMKFNGVNPCHVTMMEIKARKGDEQILKDKFLEVIKGRQNLRSVSSDNLSSDVQISCLLEQATDANLLCRMYSGWQPWI